MMFDMEMIQEEVKTMTAEATAQEQVVKVPARNLITAEMYEDARAELETLPKKGRPSKRKLELQALVQRYEALHAEESQEEPEVQPESTEVQVSEYADQTAESEQVQAEEQQQTVEEKLIERIGCLPWVYLGQGTKTAADAVFYTARKGKKVWYYIFFCKQGQGKSFLEKRKEIIIETIKAPSEQAWRALFEEIRSTHRVSGEGNPYYNYPMWKLVKKGIKSFNFWK